MVEGSQKEEDSKRKICKTVKENYRRDKLK